MLLAEIALPGWLLAVAGLIGFLVAVGAAIAVLRSSVQTKTTEIWKQNSEALENRLSNVEEENKRCFGEQALMKTSHEAEQLVWRTENEGLKREIDTLKQTIGAGPAIEAMRQDLATHHTKMVEMMSKVEGAIGVKKRAPARRKTSVAKKKK